MYRCPCRAPLTNNFAFSPAISIIYPCAPRSTMSRRTVGKPASNWRFYFKIVDDAYIITDVIPHPK